MAEKFENDEQGYFAWLASHPHSYVLNAHKKPKNWYLVLHRATCSSISKPRKGDKEGGFTERTFLKLVDEQESRLKRWIQEKGFADFSTVCSRCFKPK